MKKLRLTKNIFLSILLIFILLGLYNPLSISEVSLSTDKIYHPIRIALVSDLHSCKYGNNQLELVEAISNENPDIICLVGDIFDDKISDGNAENFLKEISEMYPCYYVTGNHEFWAGRSAFSRKMDILEKYGIKRLTNESEELEICGNKINICGVDDPTSYLYDDDYKWKDAINDIKDNLNEENYTILLSHRPECFSAYVESGFDLVLCGHAHGGQWRIPGLLDNGLYAPDQGMFPRYTNGKYSDSNTTMIVSRGLSKESTMIPRIYNRPEIVIIEVTAQT